MVLSLKYPEKHKLVSCKYVIENIIQEEIIIHAQTKENRTECPPPRMTVELQLAEQMPHKPVNTRADNRYIRAEPSSISVQQPHNSLQNYKNLKGGKSQGWC